MKAHVTRRKLLSQGGLAAAGLALRSKGAPTPPAVKLLNALQLEPFVDPLFRPTLLSSTSRRSSEPHGAHDVPFYKLTMRQTWCKMHRDLPPTRLWSYGPDAIGPLLEAQKGQGILIEWSNALPPRHFLPIDYTLHGSGRDVPESRAIVHVHGGRTPAESDGYPEAWYPPGQSRTAYYPNEQDATTLWYHDHAMGTNRLNLYAGLMGMYLLRDERERSLNLPRGEQEVPLLLCDRQFDVKGQLFYPVSQDPAHPWVDDVAGDAMVVNGRIQPFFEVDPLRYRLRIVNAANSRFFRLSLSHSAEFLQIGSDQGLLPAPVKLAQLLLAPGERADLIVDFHESPGQRIELMNGAYALMQFHVSQRNVVDRSGVPPVLNTVERLSEARAVQTRRMTLNEFDDPTGKAMVMLLNRTPWHMPVTERVQLNSVEIWSLINLTDETHPIHLHHVRFQILDRRQFDRDKYLLENGALRYTADAMPPRPQEAGWKDVVQCPAGVITRIIIEFAGHPGRYVWHCHLQEHEANEMMRPYEIVA